MEERFQFDVVTPTRLLISEKAEMVVIPGGDGDFGVLPGHAPLLSTVRPGTVDIYDNNKVRERIFVEGGFAEVTEERCTVLAQVAMPVAAINEQETIKRRDAAQAKLEASDNPDDRKLLGHEVDSCDAMLAAVRAAEADKRRL